MKSSTLELIKQRQQAKRQAYYDMWHWCTVHFRIPVHAVIRWFKR